VSDDVDPEDPRPDGHYHIDRDADWFYVDDELASTIALGLATNGEPGDDWVLTLSAATPDGDSAAAERVAVRLTPWAQHELYVETKNLSPDAHQAGHSVECGLCGEQVPLDQAWPDNRKEPCHPDCYAEAFGATPWYDGR
jgi:hypothetical protein